MIFPGMWVFMTDDCDMLYLFGCAGADCDIYLSVCGYVCACMLFNTARSNDVLKVESRRIA